MDYTETLSFHSLYIIPYSTDFQWVCRARQKRIYKYKNKILAKPQLLCFDYILIWMLLCMNMSVAQVEIKLISILNLPLRCWPYCNDCSKIWDLFLGALFAETRVASDLDCEILETSSNSLGDKLFFSSAHSLFLRNVEFNWNVSGKLYWFSSANKNDDVHLRQTWVLMKVETFLIRY